MTHISHPLVTIATVCFNPLQQERQQALRNCLDSIKYQKYPNVEHLIIDGASHDGTVDFIKNYSKADKQIRFYSEKDYGIYDAMNKAIRLAKGEYVIFINTDDALSDIDSIGAMVAACKKDDSDFLYANADVYDSDHAHIQHTWYSTIDDMPYGYYPCHQTLMVKTSVLRELGGFTENFMANDNLLMLKLVTRNYKSVYLNRVVADFHQGGVSGAMIGAKEKMRQEHIDFFYEECGKNFSMTKEDCRLLYERSFLNEPLEKIVNLGLKLKNERWQKRFFSFYISHIKDYYSKQSSTETYKYKNVKFQFLGCIPLFSIRLQGDY